MYQYTCMHASCYMRNTPGTICQFKEDGLVSRLPSLFTSMCRPMRGTSCPKSQLKSTCLTQKFGSFLDHTETGRKRTKCDQFFCPTSDFFDFCNPYFFYHTFCNDVDFVDKITKPMQKSVTTVCLHCSFARLKNKQRSTGDQCSHNKLATLVPSSVQIKTKKSGHPPDAQFMKSGLPPKILVIRKKKLSFLMISVVIDCNIIFFLMFIV